MSNSGSSGGAGGQAGREYELPPDVKHFMRFYTGGAKSLGLTEEMAADAKQVRGLGGL